MLSLSADDTQLCGEGCGGMNSPFFGQMRWTGLGECQITKTLGSGEDRGLKDNTLVYRMSPS